MRKAELYFTSTWPNHVEKAQHIGSKEIYGPKNKSGQLSKGPQTKMLQVYAGSVKDLIS